MARKSLSGLHLTVVAEGDANTTDCWSGCAVGFATALRSLGHRVDTIDVELKGAARLVGAAVAWNPSRERWRQRYILGDATFALRSALAKRAVSRLMDAGTDVLIQVGATFDLGRTSVRGLHVVYADGNGAMALQAGAYSDISSLPSTTARRILDRERKVYHRVNRLWTFSGYLARSFEHDFGVSATKLRVVYAGANRRELELEPPRAEPTASQRILFVGRQHRRKGLDILVEAFSRARVRFPRAELHVVGPSADAATGPGVVMHGSLDPNVPEQARQLAALYRDAAMFCLPSRYEPFGVSFVEAMMASLPCVGTNQWAMPEIIIHGETGLLVPDGEVEPLADSIRQILSDPPRALRLGLAGRERAHANFTWTRVAEKMIEDSREALAVSR